jgi:hypothetical protein
VTDSLSRRLAALSHSSEGDASQPLVASSEGTSSMNPQVVVQPRVVIYSLGLLLTVELVLLAVALVSLFGVGELPQGAYQDRDVLWWTMTVNEQSLFVVVTLASGAFGGALHGVASLTAHAAAGDFDARWTLWYLLTPFVAAAVAAVVLFVLQAGLGGSASTSTSTGLFGIAAFAALAGLFSRNALNKLRDIFEVAFASGAAKEDGETKA